MRTSAGRRRVPEAGQSGGNTSEELLAAWQATFGDGMGNACTGGAMEAPTLAIPDAVVEDDAVALAEVQAGKWNMYKRRSVPRPESAPPAPPPPNQKPAKR